jgi:hypothetical protein
MRDYVNTRNKNQLFIMSWKTQGNEDESSYYLSMREAQQAGEDRLARYYLHCLRDANRLKGALRGKGQVKMDSLSKVMAMFTPTYSVHSARLHGGDRLTNTMLQHATQIVEVIAEHHAHENDTSDEDVIEQIIRGDYIE